jgi:hypothetical protein
MNEPKLEIGKDYASIVGLSGTLIYDGNGTFKRTQETGTAYRHSSRLFFEKVCQIVTSRMVEERR